LVEKLGRAVEKKYSVGSSFEQKLSIKMSESMKQRVIQ